MARSRDLAVSCVMTQTLVPTVADRLRAIVGSDHVITQPDRLVAYESDGLTAYRVAPRAVVLPETTEQVSKVLEVLHGEGIDVIPRGAGTGLSGGALPTSDGVIVGTARMNRILSIDDQNRLATVQPGVINARLTKATEPYGLYYAPDPASQSACTAVPARLPLRCCAVGSCCASAQCSTTTSTSTRCLRLCCP